MLLSNLHPCNLGLRLHVRNFHYASEKDFFVGPVNILPRDSQRLDLVFVAKENQIPCAICSVLLGSLLQTTLMFTYFTLKLPAMLPPHITPVLTPSHFSVLSLQMVSWWETRKDCLKSLRACSFAHPRGRVRQNENYGRYSNSPHLPRSIRKTAELQKSWWRSIHSWGISDDLDKGIRI